MAFSFGATNPTTTASVFGNPASTSTGTQQQQQQQQQVVNPLERIGTAVTLPVIYGDERDAIIAKWNQLQAYWGTGKGYFSQNGFVEFTPDNPYCRFKAIGYNKLPKMRNEDGLVALTIKMKEDNVTKNQQLAVDKLFEILGKKPEFSVCVEGIKTLPDDKPATGPARRIPASDAFNYFSQAHIKTQLQTQLMAESITPKTGFTSEQLKHYLDNPPSGIDPLLWQQAKLDNPDPENLIPVPMIGFKALNQRTKHQEQQTKAHQQRLDMIAHELTQLQHKHSNMLAKLEEYKRKHIELAHKLLQVITKQEICRKMGFAIQVEEEQLRVHLEKIQAELNHPTQFKNHLGATRNDFNYQMDPSLQQEIRQLLNEQQEGLKHLISIVKEDSQDIKLMEQNLSDSSINRR
ncbi:hypothetical protein KUTeg_024081 [Tegillarca granosa]|uniref:Nucleoporin Nup54 alpha-helical domain-containing protein n=1 Tax=Tegillarca granosa TaxID=220873 RepID=A0ABQ9E232_TEGGR|nr:hypothetical protein KUTeg_024081 [Tegillarca granosa]